MFETRSELVRLIAVAETGRIGGAAERLAIAQPALSRAIARLEARLGGRLFERIPTGVRPTPLGATAVERARGLLREFRAAEEEIDAAVSGRAGTFRVTATPVWMRAVIAPAAAAFRERAPGVALALRTAPFADGLRLLADGESDLHCGGADPGHLLPAFLRRERFLDLTAGIVARAGHPLLGTAPAPGDLAAWPWIDFDAATAAPAGTAAAPDGDGPASLDLLLDRLFRETGRRVATVLRAGAAGLSVMADGPWLALLPLELLHGLPGLELRPLDTAFGRHRYRVGFVARRTAGDLAPFRLLLRTVRRLALDRAGQVRTRR